MSDLAVYRVELERYDRNLVPARWRTKRVTVRAPTAKHARTKAELKNQGWKARGWPKRARATAQDDT